MASVASDRNRAKAAVPERAEGIVSRVSLTRPRPSATLWACHPTENCLEGDGLKRQKTGLVGGHLETYEDTTAERTPALREGQDP